MQVNIQLVDEQDLEEILRLQKDCYQSEAEIYNDYAIPPLLQDMQTLKKEFENSLFLKAVLATEIVGFIRAYVDGTTCFVGKLIVKKDFRNNGIGGQLLRAVETYFPDCKRWVLFTGHKSEKNLYLYCKHGYKEFKREVANTNMTMIYLEKRI